MGIDSGRKRLPLVLAMPSNTMTVYADLKHLMKRDLQNFRRNTRQSHRLNDNEYKYRVKLTRGKIKIKLKVKYA
jgi:hypothetical protein